MFELVFSALIANAIDANACKSLESFELDSARVVESVVIPAGRFDGPAGPPGAIPNQDPLPEHCRVKLQMTPSESSMINVEMWLPMESWNGKFLAIGNGGWAGSIQGYPDMQAGLRRGYVTAATDTGHTGTSMDGSFAIGDQEKIIDFAYRAMHLMTVTAKSLINQSYGEPATFSYYKGCSTGGRQGLMSAQRYPEDFDGIIAGAPANRHIHMHVAQSYQQIFLNRNPELEISEGMADKINSAVLEKCDRYDDGFLNNPHQCNIDFTQFACSNMDSDELCLSPDQLKLVESHYSGTFNTQGELIFSGQALGNPLSAMKGTGDVPPQLLFDTFRMGFQDADYDWRSFNLDTDLEIIENAAGFIDATDPDLREFKAMGGKLLLYHGWEDPGISPKNTVLYYTTVLHEMGQQQDDWLALFMVPGMGHCRSGDGPWGFDSLTTLEQWREEGLEPAQMLGTNPQSGLSRPLCAWPASAEYDGSGNKNDASNWQCRPPAGQE